MRRNMMISACCVYLPNLSSLSRSVFPNSLYLFALPHFTRIPVTRLILSPKKLPIVPNFRLTRHVMHWRYLCPGQGLELSLFTSFAWFPGILSVPLLLGSLVSQNVFFLAKIAKRSPQLSQMSWDYGLLATDY